MLVEYSTNAGRGRGAIRLEWQVCLFVSVIYICMCVCLYMYMYICVNQVNPLTRERLILVEPVTMLGRVRGAIGLEWQVCLFVYNIYICVCLVYVHMCMMNRGTTRLAADSH